MLEFKDETRNEIAGILQQIAEEGLEHPRHLDAALDAIEAIIQFQMMAEEDE